MLAERCGLDAARVVEIGPGTGQATRKLLEHGARRVVAVEPNDSLAESLEQTFGEQVEILRAPLEEAPLSPASFDLAAGASSFHWVEEATGLGAIHRALRAGGWIALWWTLFGDDRSPDAFMEATTPLLEGLDSSPTTGEEARPRHALDREARVSALQAAGFTDVRHGLIQWDATWDTAGIRALYGSFSPILALEPARRQHVLDEIALVAERDFGGRVSRILTTSLYTARKPS